MNHTEVLEQLRSVHAEYRDLFPEETSFNLRALEQRATLLHLSSHSEELEVCPAHFQRYECSVLKDGVTWKVSSTTPESIGSLPLRLRASLDAASLLGLASQRNTPELRPAPPTPPRIEALDTAPQAPQAPELRALRALSERLHEALHGLEYRFALTARDIWNISLDCSDDLSDATPTFWRATSLRLQLSLLWRNKLYRHTLTPCERWYFTPSTCWEGESANELIQILETLLTSHVQGDFDSTSFLTRGWLPHTITLDSAALDELVSLAPPVLADAVVSRLHFNTEPAASSFGANGTPDLSDAKSAQSATKETGPPRLNRPGSEDDLYPQRAEVPQQAPILSVTSEAEEERQEAAVHEARPEESQSDSQAESLVPSGPHLELSNLVRVSLSGPFVEFESLCVKDAGRHRLERRSTRIRLEDLLQGLRFTGSTELRADSAGTPFKPRAAAALQGVHAIVRREAP